MRGVSDFSSLYEGYARVTRKRDVDMRGNLATVAPCATVRAGYYEWRLRLPDLLDASFTCLNITSNPKVSGWIKLIGILERLFDITYLLKVLFLEEETSRVFVFWDPIDRLVITSLRGALSV